MWPSTRDKPLPLKLPGTLRPKETLYPIERTALAYLGEIRALDDESVSGGLAAQICSA